MTCQIDHITVVSPTLDAGSDWVFAGLGVRPQPGGQHPRMGTHNLLLRLGDAMFLEVIAVDPAAPKPSRPRWFALDALACDAPPRLGCWVARTDDIGAGLARAGADAALGQAEPMSRGALQWQISIAPDGSLPFDGVAPSLIQWHAARHPALSMPQQGCRLAALTLFHPQAARVQALLDALGLVAPGVAVAVVSAPSAGLVAQIDTAQGRRTLGAAAPGAHMRAATQA